MNIRLGQPEDYREMENLTREAFWNVLLPPFFLIRKKYQRNISVSL